MPTVKQTLRSVLLNASAMRNAVLPKLDGPAPKWKTSSPAYGLPPDCRVKCPACAGLLTQASVAVHACAACLAGDGPCAIHCCRVCGGSGLVCPRCRGDRFVRASEWETSQTVVNVVSCAACCEGAAFAPAKERAAIKRYLARWQQNGHAA